MTPEEIKALRARLGLTQAEFAEKLFLSKSSIVKIEAGVRSIGKRTIYFAEQLKNQADRMQVHQPQEGRGRP